MKILKFTAAWCQPCKAFAPILKKFAAEHGLEVEAVNIDTHDGYAKSEKYNVQAVPTTMFVDDEGRELATLTGLGEKPVEDLAKRLVQANHKLAKRKVAKDRAKKAVAAIAAAKVKKAVKP